MLIECGYPLENMHLLEVFPLYSTFLSVNRIVGVNNNVIYCFYQQIMDTDSRKKPVQQKFLDRVTTIIIVAGRTSVLLDREKDSAILIKRLCLVQRSGHQ